MSGMVINPFAFGGASAFTPADLFAASEVGLWIDPSDASTCWQDTGATTPAGDGNIVTLIQDKSGNGLHFTASMNAPVRRQDANGKWYLHADGDDIMQTAIFGSTYAQPTFWCGGFKADSLSNAANTANYLWAGREAGKQNSFALYEFGADYLFFAGASQEAGGAPDTLRHIAAVTHAGASTAFRLDQVDKTIGNPGTEGVSDVKLFARRVDDQRWNGRLYGLVFLAVPPSTADRNSLEVWMADKTGVTL